VALRVDPIDVPRPVGDALTEVVRRVAEERGLEHDAWYHDEPIWIVRERRHHGARSVVCRVQVAVFEGPDGQIVEAIPDAYAVADGRVKRKASARSRRAGIQSARLPQPPSESEPIAKLILRAWKAASALADGLSTES
jgi:hypothetical protein